MSKSARSERAARRKFALSSARLTGDLRPYKISTRTSRTAELALLGAVADSLDSGAGLLAAAEGPRRDQTRNLLPMAGDHNYLPLLHQIEQLTKFVLRLEGTDLAHWGYPLGNLLA